MRVVAFGVILLLLSFSEANGQSDSVKKIEAWCLHQAKQIKESFPHMSDLEVSFFLEKGYKGFVAIRFDEEGELSSARYYDWELKFRNNKIYRLTTSINSQIDSVNFFTNDLDIRFALTDTTVKPSDRKDDCYFIRFANYTLALMPLKIYYSDQLVAISNDGHTFYNVSGQYLDDFSFAQILNALREDEDFELYYKDFETISSQW